MPLDVLMAAPGGPALTWLRLAAFGPGGGPELAVSDRDLIQGFSDRLGLTTRVATRVGRDGLERSLGHVTADRFLQRRLKAVAAGVAYVELIRKVGDLAAAAGIEVVLLKHAALLAEGLTPTGSREACDIDVLVPERSVRHLFDILVADGFKASPCGLYEHHAPALHRPDLGTLELHRCLPGVRRSKVERFSRLEDLASRGALQRRDLEGIPVLTPVRAALVAHLVVHGLVQHGDRPNSYPILRMFADLSDLGLFRAGSQAVREQQEAWEWCRADVPRSRFDAMLELGRALEAGDGVEGMSARARRLYSHIVSGTLDPDYITMTNLALFRRPLSDTPVRSWAASLGGTLFPGRGIDVIEKRETGPGLQRLLRNRLLRPFGLAARLVLSLAAAYRVHRRGGRLVWG